MSPSFCHSGNWLQISTLLDCDFSCQHSLWTWLPLSFSKVLETFNQWIQLDPSHGGKDYGCQDTMEGSGPVFNTHSSLCPLVSLIPPCKGSLNILNLVTMSNGQGTGKYTHGCAFSSFQPYHFLLHSILTKYQVPQPSFRFLSVTEGLKESRG